MEEEEEKKITEEQRKRAAINRAAALAKRKAILSLSDQDTLQKNPAWNLFKCRKLSPTKPENFPLKQTSVVGSNGPYQENTKKFRARLEICSPDSFSVTPVAVEGFSFPGEDACFQKLRDALSNVILSHYTQNTGGGQACVYKLHDYDAVLRSLKNCQVIESEEIPWRTYNIIERLLPSFVAGKWMPCRPEHLPDEKVDELISKLPKSLLKALLPFQLDGVRFGLRRGGRCLIADEMGLGKTLQAITIASCFTNEGSILVVCPAILRHTWADELERWLPFCLPSDIHLVFGQQDNPSRLDKCPKVVVISYHMLRRLQSSMLAEEWTTLIVDESHHLRCNKKSSEKEELKAILDVAVKAKHLILLSGTPSLSRPGLLGQTKFEFAKAYCSIKFLRGRQGKVFQDISRGIRLEELNILLKQSIMIRRLKEQVLPELPPKRRQIINLVLKRSDINFAMVALGLDRFDASADDGAENIHITVSDEGLESDMIKILSKKLSALGMAKVPGFLEWLSLHPITSEMDAEETTEESSGSHKMIIFAYHHKVLDGVQAFLCEKGIHFVRIDCTVTGTDRESAIRSFQSSKGVKIALIGIRAGSSGLNLSAADNVVFLELPMTPGDIQQAEDRAHRHGQKRLVNIYIFCAKDTADEFQWQQLNRSLLRVSSTVNGKHGAIQEIKVEGVSSFDMSTTCQKNRQCMKLLTSCANRGSQILRVSHDSHIEVNRDDTEQNVSKPTPHGDGCTNEVEYEEENSIVSTTLRFEVSKHTGRIHLYSCIPGTDKRPRPLFANFRQEEVECHSAENYKSIMDNPLYRDALVAFINEWKKLRPIERRKLINKPLQLPLTCELCYLNECLNHDNGGLLRGGSKRRKTPVTEVSHPLPSNAVWRKVNLCGGRSQKDKLYTQGWSETDEPLCKLCQIPCKGNNAKAPLFFEDLFCSLECFEEYRSRTSNRFVRQELFKIEFGICANCQLDCHQLVNHLRPLSLEKRREYIKKVAPSMAKREGVLEKLAQDPTEGNAWHADHIIPVYKGGGECRLENMRTLCVACHYNVTTSQCEERRIVRKNAKKILKEAMIYLANVEKCRKIDVLKDYDLNLQRSKLENDLLMDVPGSSYSRADDCRNEQISNQESVAGCSSRYNCPDSGGTPRLAHGGKACQILENPSDCASGQIFSDNGETSRLSDDEKACQKLKNPSDPVESGYIYGVKASEIDPVESGYIYGVKASEMESGEEVSHEQGKLSISFHPPLS